MRNTYRFAFDGQGVYQPDLSVISESAGNSDDWVYSELYRLAGNVGGTIARGVLRHGATNTGAEQIVSGQAVGLSGKIRVQAITVMVGSRSLEATDARSNARGTLSGFSVAEGSLASATDVTIAANPSGFPRFDLVYARLAEIPKDPVLRKVKDVGSGVVSEPSVAPYWYTRVEILTVQGTPGAAAQFPAVPADGDVIVGSGSYPSWNVPLAYIRVPNGATSGTQYGIDSIHHVAPCLRPHSAAGGEGVDVASTNSVLNSTQQGDFASGGYVPPHVLPASLTGEESLWICLDLTAASSAAHSHQVNSVIDARDWRMRVCTYMLSVAPLAGKAPWHGLTGISETGIVANGGAQDPTAANNYVACGVGQSMIRNGDAYKSGAAQVANITTATTANVLAPVRLYVDLLDGGKLKLHWTTNPRCLVFGKLSFSAPFGVRQ